MKILELTLFCKDIPSQKDFYSKTLGVELILESESSITFQIGLTKLTFEQTKIPYKYHYCFLIPSNKLEEALVWLQNRLNVVELEKAKFIHHFESWNAHSIYFYDGTGNIAEFIVRHDLKNETDKPFDASQILSVNEIGAPSSKIKEMNTILKSELNTKYWKGNIDRFITNGDQKGLFLLVNNDIKKTWFPTDVNTQSSPFLANIESTNKIFFLDFYCTPNLLKINNKIFKL